MPVTVNEEDELEEVDVKGNTRTLAQLLAGLIPILSTDPSKLRLALRKKAIVIFHNLPEGDVGIYILLPANRQGALVVETTKGIPAGMVVRALEGMQAERSKEDTRLTEAIEAWKQVEDLVAGEIMQHAQISSTNCCFCCC